MAVYNFTRVVVWDNLGGTVKVARRQIVQVLDPNTLATAAGLTQDGQPVSTVVTDTKGSVSFQTTIPVVRLVAPTGFWQEIPSRDLWSNITVGSVPFAASGEVATTKAVRADDQRLQVARDLVDGEDFNTLTTAGRYRGAGAAGLLNLPPFETPQASFSGFVEVVNRAATDTWATQIVTRYGVAPERWWRVSQTTTGAWGSWSRVANPDTDNSVGAANARLIEDWSRRRGGVKSTNGKGAVAIRFDHGLTNLKATIRPLMVARGFPFSIAMNPSNWGIAENSGATMADVQSWVDFDKCEIWNHGGNHADATTPAALYAQLVTSLTTLRSQIPNAQIDGFVLPGVGGTQYLGFDGASPDVFTKTLAGRLLLKSHAVITGAIGSPRRVLDGQVRQGLAHYTMDSASFASIKGQIDLAISERTGLQLFMHPSQLDLAGKISTATLTQVLDYIKTKVDAGDLVILGQYDMLLASSVAGTGTPGAPGAPGVVSDTSLADALTSGGATSAAFNAKGDARYVKQADGDLRYQRGLSIVTPEMFGAVGDGVTDDTTALRNFFASLNTNGGYGSAVGAYFITGAVTVNGLAGKPFTVEGAAQGRIIARFPSSSSVINLNNCTSVKLRNIALDCGRAETGFSNHGIAAANCVTCSIEGVSVTNWLNTAILFFYQSTLTGASIRNHIIDARLDGGGAANNGIMLEGTVEGSIVNPRVHNLGRSGNPGYGIQFKNDTRRCRVIGGYVDSAVAGVAFGQTTGIGPSSNSIEGTFAYNCKAGFLAGFSNNNTIRMKIDMASATDMLQAVRFENGCIGNTVVADVDNVYTTAAAIRLDGSDNRVHLTHVNGMGARIYQILGAGSTRNQIRVGNVVGATGTPFTSSTDAGTGNVAVYEGP